MADHIQASPLHSRIQLKALGSKFNSQLTSRVPTSPTLIGESVCASEAIIFLSDLESSLLFSRLAMETIDLSKDEFFMRNHLGQMECKLCLTLHPTEGAQHKLLIFSL
jgi:hypothetical protein